MSAAASSENGSDGPVMTLVNKKLRALRKKYNKILIMEESLSKGTALNKDQLEVLAAKPAVRILIDEYDKLRNPLAAAIKEEIDAAVAHLSPSPPPKPQPIPVILGEHEILVPDNNNSVVDGVDVSDAEVRANLNKVVSSDYTNGTPVPAGVTPQFIAPVQVSSVTTEAEEETYHSDHQDTGADQSTPVEELPKEEPEITNSVDDNSVEDKKLENNEEDDNEGFKDVKPRRGHQNYRGGNRGVGGRFRDYPNGRGGRSNRGGGYQNGRGQYFDQPGNYRSRNYNTRGRGSAGKVAGANGYSNGTVRDGEERHT